MTWSARQYLAFEDERSRPARDLVAAIPRNEIRRAVDLGCGPGNSTEILAQRFPQADIRGVDSSPDMIAAARARLPHVAFEIADLQIWSSADPMDVILSNAALQWARDHASLFPRLVSLLAPGGCLAVQMPDNLDEPCQALMREVAASGPWARKLASAATSRAQRAHWSWYYKLLRGQCERLDLWRTTYVHQLSGGADAIVEWFKGSGLRPFLDALEESERAEFLAAYKAEIARAYPIFDDGAALLPFPRLFLVATR